jgi:UDP-N-acetylglucosamine 1-carboxyvinyltransferase
MESFIIKGGQPLSGTIRPAGNKNAALPIVAASLLADEPVVLRNVPHILDVETMLELVASTGATVERTGPNEVRIDPRGLRRASLDPVLCTRIRASVLLAAPLVARTGHCLLPPPGGDVIGRRRLDTHLLAFRSLGVHASFDRALELEVGRLRGASMFLDEASVTATENAVMAAVLAEGETTIGNAACEPHVQDLCRFLVGLGARISGIGSNLLRIEGVERLGGGEHTIGTDYIEVASFVGLAAVTGGELVVEGVIEDDLRPVEVGFSRLGLTWELDSGRLRVPRDQPLEVEDDLGQAIPKIDDGPWPAFPADLTSIAVAVATQARGTVPPTASRSSATSARSTGATSASTSACGPWGPTSSAPAEAGPGAGGMALGAGDCERLHDGLVAQPVNTASALAYLAVGAWLVGRGLLSGAAGRPSPSRPATVAFGVAVAAAGVGSIDYHGPGSPAARLLHDGGLYAVVGLVAWHEVARRVGRARLTPRGRVAYRAALVATAFGAACWWAGRTASPWCDPDSLLQGHAAWHLLGAAALAAWAMAALEETPPP